MVRVTYHIVVNSRETVYYKPINLKQNYSALSAAMLRLMEYY